MSYTKETDNKSVFKRILKALSATEENAVDKTLKEFVDKKTINKVTGQKEEELYKPSSEDLKSSYILPPEKGIDGR